MQVLEAARNSGLAGIDYNKTNDRDAYGEIADYFQGAINGSGLGGEIMQGIGNDPLGNPIPAAWSWKINLDEGGTQLVQNGDATQQIRQTGDGSELASIPFSSFFPGVTRLGQLYANVGDGLTLIEALGGPIGIISTGGTVVIEGLGENIEIGSVATNELRLGGLPGQNTVGAAGTADPPPATPQGWFKVGAFNIDTFVYEEGLVPYYPLP